MSQIRTENNTGFSLVGQKFSDYSQLVKLRLNLTVVFSSVMAYLIACGGTTNLTLLLVLSIGGFLVTGASIYTPMKRVSPAAVFIGAVPGALPMMIGCVAAEGTITGLSVALFSLQFIWQLPHFWAIGWLAFEDYNRAGFKFLEAQDQQLGKQSFIYAILLIPISWMPYLLDVSGIVSAILLTIAAIIYAGFAWNLYKKNNRKAALQLMFSSFFYLPLVLFALYADKIF